MTPIVQANLQRVLAACHVRRVARLELFGSAANGSYDPQRSDLDFLVEFLPMAPVELAGAYFGLAADLEVIFGRRVDLVTTASIRNPYFREAIDQSRRVLYAA
jgi:predicted nucleotidyltransferase